MLIEQFKKNAKTLLRAAKAGEGAALARVDSVLHRRDLCLMKMQHVVAVEAGFESWAALTEAHAVELAYIISTQKKPLPKTLSRMAWQNVMVAAINAALDQGLFTLELGDHPVNRPDVEARQPGAIYRFRFAGGVDAVAYLNDAGYDELVFHVALWPTPEAERWVSAAFSGFLAGEVWAEGWLERKNGQWLQQGSGKRLFKCRRNRLATVAGSTVTPAGYRAQGPFCM